MDNFTNKFNKYMDQISYFSIDIDNKSKDKKIKEASIKIVDLYVELASISNEETVYFPDDFEYSSFYGYDDDDEDEKKSKCIDLQKTILKRCAENGALEVFKEFHKRSMDNVFYVGFEWTNENLETKSLMRGHVDTSNFILKHKKTTLEYPRKLKTIDKNGNIESKKSESFGVLITSIIYSDKDGRFDLYLDMIKNLCASENPSVNKKIAIENITTVLCLCLTSSNNRVSDSFDVIFNKALEHGWKIETEDQMNDIYKAAMLSTNNNNLKLMRIVDKELNFDFTKKINLKKISLDEVDCPKNMSNEEFFEMKNKYRGLHINNALSFSFAYSPVLTDYILNEKGYSAKDFNFGSFEETPLHWLITSMKRSEVSYILKENNMSFLFDMIDNGISTNKQNALKQTPLDLIKEIDNRQEKTGFLDAVCVYLEYIKEYKNDNITYDYFIKKRSDILESYSFNEEELLEIEKENGNIITGINISAIERCTEKHNKRNGEKFLIEYEKNKFKECVTKNNEHSFVGMKI